MTRGDGDREGVGLRPDLTGHGLGSQFFTYVLQDLARRYPSAAVRLTVAKFNRRAIALYSRFGFRYETEFEQGKTTFQMMKLLKA